MLRVRLEIVPYGVEKDAYEIGQLHIFNKGLNMFGHYAYGVIDVTPGQEGMFDKDVLHRRHLGAWELVRKVIDELKVHTAVER